MAGPAGHVTGVVRDQDGAPVGGARVFFTSAPAPIADVAHLTGPDGSFTLAAPAPGSYVLECFSDEHAAARVVLEVPGAEPVALTLGPA